MKKNRIFKTYRSIVWILLAVLLLCPVTNVFAEPSETEGETGVIGELAPIDEDVEALEKPQETEEAEEEQEGAGFSVDSIYVQNGKLYLFLQFKDAGEAKNVSVSLKDDQNDSVSPTQIMESDTVVNYFLLIDLYAARGDYQALVREFAEALLKAEAQNIRVTIATVGEAFEVIGENLEKEEKIFDILKNLSYESGKSSDYYTGILEALDYVKHSYREDGAFVNLLLLTDGKENSNGVSLGNNPLDSAKKVNDAISSTGDLLVHSIEFSPWDEILKSAVMEGNGISTDITKNGATASGRMLAGYTDSFYVMEHSVESTMDETMEICFQVNYMDAETGETLTTQEQVIESVSNRDAIEIIAPEDVVIVEGEEEMPLETEEEQQEASDEEGFPIPVIAAVAVGVIIILAVIVLAAGKRKSGQNAEDRKSNQKGVPFKLDVLQGKCKNKTNPYILSDQMTIGSGKGCDIIFADETVTEKNCRIYVQDGQLYIEDLNRRSNTVINGMKIYAPNQLYSGDEIELGDVVFRIYY